MPRKTASRRAAISGRFCFNEAAARCHGKLAGRIGRGAGYLASMRPRPDATENAGAAGYRRPPVSASMRPRPDATENQAIVHRIIDVPLRLQ